MITDLTPVRFRVALTAVFFGVSVLAYTLLHFAH